MPNFVVIRLAEGAGASEVNTRDRRMAMMNMGSISLVMANPLVGSSAQDRAMLLHLYPFIYPQASLFYLMMMAGGHRLC